MKIEISKIIVEERIRKDLKNIDILAQSIKDENMISPILLRKNNNGTYKLLAGQRRLEAHRKLQMMQIEAIIRKQSDIDRISESEYMKNLPHDVRIELIENENREGFTESEKAEFAEKYRPYFKEQTQQGRRTDLENSTLSKPLAKVKPESVDEKIGKILKESGETVRKRTKVFQNIDDDTKKSLDSGEKSLHSAYQKTIAKENENRPIPHLPIGKFNHIVEDPGWDFGNKNIGGSGKSGAAFHYRTEPTNKIARIPDPQLQLIMQYCTCGVQISI